MLSSLFLKWCFLSEWRLKIIANELTRNYFDLPSQLWLLLVPLLTVLPSLFSTVLQVLKSFNAILLNLNNQILNFYISFFNCFDKLFSIFVPLRELDWLYERGKGTSSMRGCFLVQCWGNWSYFPKHLHLSLLRLRQQIYEVANLVALWYLKMEVLLQNLKTDILLEALAKFWNAERTSSTLWKGQRYIKYDGLIPSAVLRKLVLLS